MIGSPFRATRRAPRPHATAAAASAATSAARTPRAGGGARPSSLRVPRHRREVPGGRRPAERGAADARRSAFLRAGGRRGRRARDGSRTARRRPRQRRRTAATSRRVRSRRGRLRPRSRGRRGRRRGGSSAPAVSRAAVDVRRRARSRCPRLHRSPSSWSSLTAQSCGRLGLGLRPSTRERVARAAQPPGSRARPPWAAEGSGAGVWCGRRLGRRRREGGTPRRKEGERVDVGLGRRRRGRRGGRTERRARPRPWGRLRRGRHPPRRRPPRRTRSVPEVGERDLGVADGDRHREAVRRNGAGERHLPRDRRANRSRSLERDVDPAMLSGGVGVPADREAAEHGAVRRPRPGERGRSRRECPDERDAEARSPTALSVERTWTRRYRETARAATQCDSLVTETRGRASLRDVPVRRETTSAAARRPAPAATSSATAARAASSVDVRRRRRPCSRGRA